MRARFCGKTLNTRGITPGKHDLVSYFARAFDECRIGTAVEVVPGLF